MSAIDEDIFPPPPLKPKEPADASKMVPMSEGILSGRLPFPEIVGPMWDAINEQYGTDYKLPE